MELEQIRTFTAQTIGVPPSLLDGKNAKEILSKARELIAYRRSQEPEKELSTKEKFKAWLDDDYKKNSLYCTAEELSEEPDPVLAALDRLETMLRGYPALTEDGGEFDISGLPDPRPTNEQFAEWFWNQDVNQYNPNKDKDGWIHFG